jgi:hypothetical protein
MATVKIEKKKKKRKKMEHLGKVIGKREHNSFLPQHQKWGQQVHTEILLFQFTI